jgi:very-short-patch-repair endonuclease
MQSKVPAALSPGEELFAMQCRCYNFHPEREFKFCEGRKWAFDFCFPAQMVAIEIEGGTLFGKSRHSRGVGFEQDCRKYNTATRMGWKVYRFSTEMVKRGEAIGDLLNCIFQEDLG